MSLEPTEDDRECPARISRRTFVIATGAGVSSSLVPCLVGAVTATPDKPVSYPSTRIIDIASLKVDAPVTFSYPDENSPALLVRMKQAVPGGVGPEGSIVAYSQLCTHKGCPVAYRPDRKLLICPCHWSSFDPAKSGQMVIGQGSHSLPRITLRVDGGAVHAVGVEGLIFGRHTNVL